MVNVSGMFFMASGVSHLTNGKGVKFLSRLLNASCIDVITVPLFFSLPLKPPPAPKVVLTLMQHGSL